jgi:TolB-like protein
MPRLLLSLAAAILPLTVRAAPKPTVAILYFDYQGKDDQMGMLRKGLAQMLISDLSGNEAFQIVERDRLQEVLDELRLNQTNKIDKGSANEIGKLLGARYMVMGGYFDLMGTLRIDARVVEVETGKILKSIGGSSKPDSFIELEQKLSSDLGTILSGSLSSPEAADPKRIASRAAPPKKLQVATAVKYSEALDALDKKDKATAKKKMEEVVKEQPDFSLAQMDLKSLVQ